MSGLDPTHLVRDFGDARAEALACRGDCALFDFSFLARASLSGPRARDDLQQFCGRSLAGLMPGRLVYALRCDAGHRVVSDLTIWCLAQNMFELMSGRHEDVAGLAGACHRSSDLRDLSGNTAVIAVQGPRSLAALAGMVDARALAALPYFGHAAFDAFGARCRIGRVGYTGERGFEVVLARERFADAWRALAERARPAGFAAADCLRIEAGFMLFVNECRLGATPRELGLGFCYAPACPPPVMRLVGFFADGPAPPPLWQPPGGGTSPPGEGEIVVTSVCFSPTLGRTLGLGFVAAGAANPGARVLDRRSGFGEVALAGLPFVDPEKRRARGAWPTPPAERPEPG